ncbi:hypothetical protein HDU96_004037 [Phlyctochytrium bullatum]|nr:hypothetical protein HDU96_004037 [Phlyctochytrium bullatum]
MPREVLLAELLKVAKISKKRGRKVTASQVQAASPSSLDGKVDRSKSATPDKDWCLDDVELKHVPWISEFLEVMEEDASEDEEPIFSLRRFLETNPSARQFVEEAHFVLGRRRPAVRRIQGIAKAQVLLHLLPILRLPFLNKRILVQAFKSTPIVDVARLLAQQSHPHLLPLDLLVIGSRNPKDLSLFHRVAYVKRELLQLLADLDAAFAAYGVGRREDLDRWCSERGHGGATACDGRCAAASVPRVEARGGGLLTSLREAVGKAVGNLWFVAQAPVDVLELLFALHAALGVPERTRSLAAGCVASSRAAVMARRLAFDIMARMFETQEWMLTDELETWFLKKAAVLFWADGRRKVNGTGKFDVVIADEAVHSKTPISIEFPTVLILVGSSPSHRPANPIASSPATCGQENMIQDTDQAMQEAAGTESVTADVQVAKPCTSNASYKSLTRVSSTAKLLADVCGPMPVAGLPKDRWSLPRRRVAFPWHVVKKVKRTERNKKERGQSDGDAEWTDVDGVGDGEGDGDAVEFAEEETGSKDIVGEDTAVMVVTDGYMPDTSGVNDGEPEHNSDNGERENQVLATVAEMIASDLKPETTCSNAAAEVAISPTDEPTTRPSDGVLTSTDEPETRYTDDVVGVSMSSTQSDTQTDPEVSLDEAAAKSSESKPQLYAPASATAPQPEPTPPPPRNGVQASPGLGAEEKVMAGENATWSTLHLEDGVGAKIDGGGGREDMMEGQIGRGGATEEAGREGRVAVVAGTCEHEIRRGSGVTDVEESLALASGEMSGEGTPVVVAGEPEIRNSGDAAELGVSSLLEELEEGKLVAVAASAAKPDPCDSSEVLELPASPFFEAFEEWMPVAMVARAAEPETCDSSFAQELSAFPPLREVEEWKPAALVASSPEPEEFGSCSESEIHNLWEVATEDTDFFLETTSGDEEAMGRDYELSLNSPSAASVDSFAVPEASSAKETAPTLSTDCQQSTISSLDCSLFWDAAEDVSSSEQGYVSCDEESELSDEYHTCEEAEEEEPAATARASKSLRAELTVNKMGPLRMDSPTALNTRRFQSAMLRAAEAAASESSRSAALKPVTAESSAGLDARPAPRDKLGVSLQRNAAGKMLQRQGLLRREDAARARSRDDGTVAAACEGQCSQTSVVPREERVGASLFRNALEKISSQQGPSLQQPGPESSTSAPEPRKRLLPPSSRGETTGALRMDSVPTRKGVPSAASGSKKSTAPSREPTSGSKKAGKEPGPNFHCAAEKILARERR